MRKFFSAILAVLLLLNFGVLGLNAQAVELESGEAVKNEKIAAGSSRSIWVRENGTIATVGGVGGKTNEWKNITQVAAYNHIVGLKEDGTVVVDGYVPGAYNMKNWTGIVEIDANENNTIGLTSDGTVVVTGYNTYGQCNVSNWTDIVDVEMGYRTAYGLKSDGTVRAAGNNDIKQCDVESWSDIIAISAGNFHLPDKQGQTRPLG